MVFRMRFCLANDGRSRNIIRWRGVDNCKCGILPCKRVVVKEFTLNRCPSAKAGQMMTPDRESCRGVLSTARSLSNPEA